MAKGILSGILSSIRSSFNNKKITPEDSKEPSKETSQNSETNLSLKALSKEGILNIKQKTNDIPSHIEFEPFDSVDTEFDNLSEQELLNKSKELLNKNKGLLKEIYDEGFDDKKPDPETHSKEFDEFQAVRDRLSQLSEEKAQPPIREEKPQYTEKNKSTLRSSQNYVKRIEEEKENKSLSLD